tara:strand:+ start:10452 stop:11588 length:1137 start_codon:yes stop_codon:yes gene_type:complete
MMINSDQPIEIAGAGPAGLAAAITLARAGRQVIVHEARKNVGERFQGDFQGLENWTTERDVLLDLQQSGFTTNFDALPCTSGIVFDHRDREYRIQTAKPLFYMVERGSKETSLDSALMTQAQDLGVEIKFNNRISHIEGPGIMATGPRKADAISVGYHGETTMENGFWAICDDRLAPKGYAYLLVWDGRATIKTCMFRDFKKERRYVDRTVEAFRRLVGFEMFNPRPHGGAGNFRIPDRARFGSHLEVGEQAGFQDTLWGFGMRYAMKSGELAAKSLIEGVDYDTLWKNHFGKQLETGITNRVLFELLGNRGYRWFISHLSGNEKLREKLFRHYQPTLIKRLLYPWARRRFKSRRNDESCNHINCSCVWCRLCAAGKN